MKILKWILIVIAAIVVIFLVYSSTQPSKAVTQQSIEIDAPASQIYEVLIDFPDWSSWSVWSQKDTNMTTEYSETFGEVGSYSSWKSDHPEVGTGRQEVIEVRENEYLKMEMNFTDWPGTKYAEFILKENEGKTEVTWTYEGSETPFYLNFMNPLIAGMLDKDYKTGLENLKAYVESMPTEVANPMNLEIVEVEPVNIVSIKDSCTADEISAKLGELYTELSIFLEMAKKAESNGMPLALYHWYSPEKVILEGAIPYSGEVKPSGRVQVKTTPGGKVIKGIHYGDYNGTEQMHIGIETFAKASQLNFAGPCWEVYANDPTLVDSAAVETHIYYPVE